MKKGDVVNLRERSDCEEFVCGISGHSWDDLVKENPHTVQCVYDDSVILEDSIFSFRKEDLRVVGTEITIVKGSKYRIKNLTPSEKMMGPGWTCGMDEFVGEVVTVVDDLQNGRVEIEEDGGVYSWDIRWLELVDEHPPKQEKIKMSSWEFRDTDIDFTQICIDAIEDGKPAFLVVGDGRAYVGGLESPVMVSGVTDLNISDYLGKQYPYSIFEIPISQVKTWIVRLEEYSREYKKFKAENKEYILNRDREKGNKKFKVMVW